MACPKPDRPVQDEFVVLGDGGVELELGDRAAADQSPTIQTEISQ